MLLYIHIPFCDSKCYYCAFNSYTYLHHLKNDFVQALCKQLEFELKNLPKNLIETVFIGGGTPSTLDFEHFEKIFKLLNPYLTTTKEITCEANPNSANKKWLDKVNNLGINRISFGVQSFDDKKLKFLGRNHNKKTAIKAIQNAKEVGFEHINCDIIYDTILDTKKLIDSDLNIIKDLPIDHISAYSLTLEDGTKFYNKPKVKVDDENMAKYLFKRLNKMGFEQYEISNFAKNKNSKSKHNLGYWKYKEYLGVGAGAVGCNGQKRLYTQKDVNMYIDNPLIYSHIETLSAEDIKVEKVLLGLRCEIGVDKKVLNDKELKQVFKLEKFGKLKQTKDKFYANDFLLADELALYILE